MNGRTRAWLTLVRLPNVFTAAADAIGGFLYMGGRLDDWPMLFALVGASSCLYAGGVALNDVCDVERDRIKRPDRPIPSGHVARELALRVSLVLLAGGVGLAALAGARPAGAALMLVGVIVLYDTGDKERAIAPMLMGACRALNLAMAVSVSEECFKLSALVPIGLLWFYVASLTLLARHEVGNSSRKDRVLGAAGACLAVAGLTSLALLMEDLGAIYFAAVVVTTLFVAGHGVAAVRDGIPVTIQRSVTNLVLGIMMFDACLVIAARGIFHALLIAAPAGAAIASARVIRVT